MRYACPPRRFCPTRPAKFVARLNFLCLIYLLLITLPALAESQGPPAFLALDGSKARSRIVIGREGTNDDRQAAMLLRDYIARATGKELTLVSEADYRPAEDEGLFVVGPGELNQSLGLSIKDLEVEEFVVRSKPKMIGFIGHNDTNSPASSWAVRYFIDAVLGVRVLWPGKIGTYVPERSTLEVPIVNYRFRPLAFRKFRTWPKKAHPELEAWLEAHQLSSRGHNRSNYRFGHAFTDWWERFSADEHTRKYFAENPQGETVLFNDKKPQNAKLNLGNPAVRQQIISDWKAAGGDSPASWPATWNICPNDGSGFDTSSASRALDDKQHPKETIWAGKVNLTPRYVRFWTTLRKEMLAELPTTELRERFNLTTYAYGAYRRPPPPGSLTPGIVLQIVPTYDAAGKENWLGWRKAGASALLCRPNWWHMGGSAPHIPLRKVYDFVRFAGDNGMVGIDMDIIFPYWATQGINYYLLARMLSRPELKVDDIINEYTEAFGKAAPEVKKYLRYWEEYTEKAALPFPIGGAASQNKNGLYDTLQRKHGFKYHPLKGSWESLPYLYPPEVSAPAEKFLAAAQKKVKPASPEAKRVAFLKDGLSLFVLQRDLIEAYNNAPRKQRKKDRRVQEISRKWEALRDRMRLDYGYVIDLDALPDRLAN